MSILPLGAFSSITIWIIALVTAASLAAFQRPQLASDWILEPYKVLQGRKYYTLLTSGLIHADFQHLIFNMLTLYFFGIALENYYEIGYDIPGFWVAGLFLSGILFSSIPSLIKHGKNRGYSTLGASGGVEAVIFASILMNPMSDICLYFAFCLPGFLVGVLYLAYSYYQSKNGQDFVNHDAHLAGALYGLVWQTVLTPGVWANILGLLS
jgi:membrane associated rhomboid family serine protease